MKAILRACLTVAAVAAVAAQAPQRASSAEGLLEASGLKAGLAVHVNCPDGKTAAAIARGGKFLVHALSDDAGVVARARAEIEKQGVYGQASVEHLPLKPLPHATGTVNLLIAEDLGKCLASGLTVGEMLRVVCPGGVALVGGGGIAEAELKAKVAGGAGEFQIVSLGGGAWAKVRKPRPAEMDEWQQYMHGADRNAVSRDTLAGPPASLQWLAGTEWPKGPGHSAGTYVALSANGRNFYLTANTVANLSAPRERIRFHVLARDAHNGLFLWERAWEDPHVMERANTVYMKDVFRLRPLPLAAVGERVYAGGVKTNHLTTLEAATGQTLGTVDLGEAIREIACHDGKIVARTVKQVCLADPEGGKVLWKRDAQTEEIVVGDGGVFFLIGQNHPFKLVRVDLADGQEKWQESTQSWGPPTSGPRKGTLNLRCYQDGMLVVSERATGEIHLVSTRDGKRLWSSGARAGFRDAGAFCIDGLVWASRQESGGRRGGTSVWEGLDPATGKVVKSVKTTQSPGGCGVMVATSRYLLFSRGISLLDLATAQPHEFSGARGPCNVHMVPANGLLYNLPQACRCVTPAVRGFLALSPAKMTWSEDRLKDAPDRLVKGPAYAAAAEMKLTPAGKTDWPALRHDPARSGTAPQAVPAEARVLWDVKLTDRPAGALKEDLTLNQAYGDPLSAPVVAGGRVYVALPNSHRLLALSAADGARQWAFTAGGMIDSPPTVAGDFVVFGTRTGWLYCLRAGDGELVWRSRAAPLERRIVAFGQLESPWRASGSVLVLDGVAYCPAGRSPAVDNGLLVSAVEVRTGKVLWQRREANFWGMGKPVLSADGGRVYMDQSVDGRPNSITYDPKTGERGRGSLYLTGGTVSGLLNGHWRKMPLSRHCEQYPWRYGDAEGHFLAFDEKRVYGYQEIVDPRDKGKGKVNAGWARMPACQLFARTRTETPGKSQPAWAWPVPEPAQVEALVLAGEVLLAAGCTDKDNPVKGRLWAVSATDGKPLAQRDLDVPPVFDGLAAAGGRLYAALQDGRVLCLGEK